MDEDYSTNLFGEEVKAELSEEEISLDKKPRPDFNIFLLSDAIASRKKKDAWIIYQKALAGGLTPDEIFWNIEWQIKTLLLALRTKSAEEAGMKNYPYSKAKANLKHWTQEELENFLKELLVGYHEARRGKEEMETLLEKMILGI